MRSLVRKIAIRIGEPFAQDVAQPLEHLAQAPAVGAEEVTVLHYYPAATRLTATGMVAPRVNRTQQSELVRLGAHVSVPLS